MLPGSCFLQFPKHGAPNAPCPKWSPRATPGESWSPRKNGSASEDGYPFPTWVGWKSHWNILKLYTVINYTYLQIISNDVMIGSNFDHRVFFGDEENCKHPLDYTLIPRYSCLKLWTGTTSPKRIDMSQLICASATLVYWHFSASPVNWSFGTISRVANHDYR